MQSNHLDEAIEKAVSAVSAAIRQTMRESCGSNTTPELFEMPCAELSNTTQATTSTAFVSIVYYAFRPKKIFSVNHLFVY